MLKPVSAHRAASLRDEEVDVVAQPLSQVGDDRVLAHLAKVRATNVRRLVPGYIKARIKKGEIPALQTIARVETKVPHQTRHA